MSNKMNNSNSNSNTITITKSKIIKIKKPVEKPVEKPMTISHINKRINKEICKETLTKLKDENLLDEYKECKSVKNEIEKLTQILEKHKISDEKIDLILKDYTPNLVPAGTKGVIRGNKFNSIVKDKIKSFNLDSTRFEICFEKQCKSCITSEIPDWYIRDTTSNRVIIGMNQLDLWQGGQQLNRGSKYLIDNKYNTEQSKLVCVIANHLQLKKPNKKSQLFEVGFTNNTLTYLNNLENIILKYFN